MRLFLIRYKTLVVAILLLSISSIAMSKKIESDKLYFRSYLFGVFFSVETSILNIKNSISNVFSNNRNVRQLELELAEAEQQILYYKELSRLYIHLKQENDQLRQNLNLQTRINYSVHYSKVLFRDPSLLSDFLIVDKGRKAGIRINMPVVYSAPGTEQLILIGKTVEVGQNYSRIRVITAKNFYVGVKSLDTGYTGVLRGQGSWNQNLTLEYMPIEAQLSIGEKIVTSGESDIYPEGLLIGEVQAIGQNVMEEFFQTLYIKSEFQYSKIDEVFILDYVNNYPDINTLGVTDDRL